MLMKSIFIFLISFVMASKAIEPVTTSLAVGGLLSSAAYFGYCKLFECCDETWIPANFQKLEERMLRDLYGQHLVHDVITNALKAHFNRNVNPKKALAMSFHGWTGSGKTYVSQFIIESLYKEGVKSKYAHFFSGRIHFPAVREKDIYKMHLSDWIRGNVSQCGRSIFVFDEVDKIPKGVLDGIKAFLDFHKEIDGTDFRKSVFIFLSNTGGELITKRMLSLWEQGIKRETVKLSDFEDLIKMGAFNEEGGFHKSETIESNLIDYYVPFLPLEKSHVTKCIQAEFKRRGFGDPPLESVREVLSDLPFGPEPVNLYSTSGCKRVSAKVGPVAERILSRFITMQNNFKLPGLILPNILEQKYVYIERLRCKQSHN